MFATVLGRLPRPTDERVPDDPGERRAADDEAVRRLLAAQQAAGIGLLADGGLRPALDLSGAEPVAVADWRFAAEAVDGGVAVKAVLPGPLTLARAAAGADVGREAARLGERLRLEIDALADAGCPLVEVEEPAVVELGESEVGRDAFADAHRRLARDAPVHVALALGSGNVPPDAYGVVLDAPYASYAVDLVAGPDNWRLVVDVPQDRGVVCGALRAVQGSDDGPELLVWAAHYAASTRRRGIDRVGLANAPGLESLPWEVARRKLERLAEAARIAALPRQGGQLRAALDPRATDLKSRAMGRHVKRTSSPD
jgi:methionine synthase II (cobalamin-independent)